MAQGLRRCDRITQTNWWALRHRVRWRMHSTSSDVTASPVGGVRTPFSPGPRRRLPCRSMSPAVSTPWRSSPSCWRSPRSCWPPSRTVGGCAGPAQAVAAAPEARRAVGRPGGDWPARPRTGAGREALAEAWLSCVTSRRPQRARRRSRRPVRGQSVRTSTPCAASSRTAARVATGGSDRPAPRGAGPLRRLRRRRRPAVLQRGAARRHRLGAGADDPGRQGRRAHLRAHDLGRLARR